MLREQAKVGMKVFFGRTHGEKTLGQIVKLNPTKAKVKTLENRGNGRGSAVGTEWGVPYSMMEPTGDKTVSVADLMPKLPPLDFNEFQPYADQQDGIPPFWMVSPCLILSPLPALFR